MKCFKWSKSFHVCNLCTLSYYNLTEFHYEQPFTGEGKLSTRIECIRPYLLQPSLKWVTIMLLYLDVLN